MTKKAVAERRYRKKRMKAKFNKQRRCPICNKHRKKVKQEHHLRMYMTGSRWYCSQYCVDVVEGMKHLQKLSDQDDTPILSWVSSSCYGNTISMVFKRRDNNGK